MILRQGDGQIGGNSGISRTAACRDHGSDLTDRSGAELEIRTKAAERPTEGSPSCSR